MLCPCGSNAKSPMQIAREEWRATIAAERAHQIEKGFDAEHDADHGLNHFLAWAQEYGRIDKPDAAAALVEVARERVAALRAYIDDPGNWSGLDARRVHLLALIDGIQPQAGQPRDLPHG